MTRLRTFLPFIFGEIPHDGQRRPVRAELSGAMYEIIDKPEMMRLEKPNIRQVLNEEIRKMKFAQQNDIAS